MIVKHVRIAHRIALVPADEVSGETGAHSGLAPQEGAPCGTMRSNPMSPLGAPAMSPRTARSPPSTSSRGRSSGGSRSARWGETGPLGIRSGLRMPAVGGPMATAGGLVFFAGTQDYRLRAFESATGRELRRAPLPVGSLATPMSCVRPDDRRCVVVSVGGLTDAQGRGDHVVAFAPPEGSVTAAAGN